MSWKLKKSIEDFKPYFPIIEDIRDLEINKTFINLSSNENMYGKPIFEINTNDLLTDLNEYPEDSSYLLRNSLSDFYNIFSDEIITGNGCSEILDMIIKAFVDKDDEVIIPEKTFPLYAFITKIVSGTPVFAKTEKLDFDLDEIIKKITNKTKVIIICNPNNPTGLIINKRDMISFLEKIPENIVVVVDEAYSEYCTSKDFPDLLKYLNKFSNLIITKSFSKIYGLAGLRVGYGIGNKELIYNLHKIRMPFNISSLAQKISCEAIKNRGFIKNTINFTNKGKEYLNKELSELGLKCYDTHANFILVDLINKDDETVKNKLLEKSIIIKNLKNWGIPNFIRVTIGNENQNKVFVEVIKDIIRNYTKL